MSIVLPATNPFTLLRTAGGLYLVTRRRWGKVTSFRDPAVTSMYRMRRHEHPIQVEVGHDSRLHNHVVFQEVPVDELVPGMLSVYFRGRSARDWVRTSNVTDTYAGDIVGSVQQGFEHVLFNDTQAWLISADGINCTRLLVRGWHGPTVARTLQELRNEMPYAQLLQVRHHQTLPDCNPGVEEAADAWRPLCDRFKRTIMEHGFTLRGVHYNPHDPNLISVLLDDVPNKRGEIGVVPWLVDKFTVLLGKLRTTCQKCGKPGVKVMIPRPYLYEHYILCDTCRARVLTPAMIRPGFSSDPFVRHRVSAGSDSVPA